ncbi:MULTISPECIES: MBOAT family O-acyltransferase [unclassified Clostridium]|uniref:MBOAT family O-acyltransferase n=1 Tax=Clostridium TaxID=1485 RepID=UPI001C8CBC1D|nr:MULTISPECIES: MBOAT family O-acyltransferase [unclassified Clostridium]MBX9137663.1 MBOAT family protein [Clostridium sp. K12(2020)]MBX9144473.1 MBOAT family protein [Clostridium sp. K13]MDU2289658.1 MBOAT family O-acyltransferase [Clostridium celatum]
MVFSSILFIFRFLPIAMVLYFLTPNKFKNLTLLGVSLAFYSWGEPKYFLIMLASIFVDYLVSRGIEKYRKNKKISIMFLLISILFNLGMLFFFKYFNFFLENINNILGISLKYVKITLPLGISFYTFQTMSYTIDVFLGKVKAEKNIINFGAFVCLFPQLIAGPIVKYTDINLALKNRKVDIYQIQEGIKLFILGLGSKVIIANNIGALWSEVEAKGFSEIGTIMAWISILAFAFQIYFDFNGYSLMAIGLGKILGFDFPRNFNYPYISRSITEFWRRWHITLGSWFKEYVYIPLGGNRVGRLRLYINLFIVWFLTGFWHGASYNFILWGIYFFILISIEKAGLLRFLEKNKIISHIYSIFFIIIGWAIFAVVDLEQLKILLQRMFTINIDNEWIYYIRNYGITFIIATLFSTPIIKNIYNKFVKSDILNTIILITIFLLCIAYLVDATYNPFLYFRF